MHRLFLALIIAVFSSQALAQKAPRASAKIFYYPYIHADPMGTTYASRGADQTFFSYLHVALEVLKQPQDYEVFMEGYYFNLYPGSKYRLVPREVRRVRRAFKKGFPKHISQWTRRQKEYLVKYGPVTVLYMLRKIRRIRSADRWISRRTMVRQLKKCTTSKFMAAFSEVNFNKLHISWPEFYTRLRHAQKGLSSKHCRRILSHREKYVVRQLKRRQVRSKKKLLLIYGYAHDFGKYFNDQLNYLGSPVLQYAASCYNLRNRRISQQVSYFCANNFEEWLSKLGHPAYFANAIPKSLRRSEVPPRIASYYSRRDTFKLADSYYKRGKYFEKSGQYQKAVGDYKKALLLNPRHSKASSDIGWTYYLLKKYNLAIRHLSHAIKIMPNYAEAYNRLGLVYVDLKDLENALGMFHRAVSLKPDYASAYNNLAWVYYETGKAKDGLPYVQKALQLNATSGVSLDTRAHIYEALGNYQKAHRDFENALKYIPNSKITREGLKRVQAKL